MALERIRLLRNVIISELGGRQIGDVVDLPRFQAVMLVGDGAAEYVQPKQTPISVTSVVPEHGDPAPRLVQTAPTPMKVKKDKETET